MEGERWWQQHGIIRADIPAEKTENDKVTIEQRAQESINILMSLTDDETIRADLTIDNLIDGTTPRITQDDLDHFEKYGIENLQLEKIPQEVRDHFEKQRSYDIVRWNKPELFIHRLERERQPKLEYRFRESPVMEAAIAEEESAKNEAAAATTNGEETRKRGSEGLSFDNLKLPSPKPKDERGSRKTNYKYINHIIMGKARTPFAMGSMPDVGSAIAYVTTAMSGSLAFVARDKILAKVEYQRDLVKDIIQYLRDRAQDLPPQLLPNTKQLQRFWEVTQQEGEFNEEIAMVSYKRELGESWVANIAVAVEASDKGVERAREAYKVGCHNFRVYSPEGGTEIVKTVQAINDQIREGKGEEKPREKDARVKIVAGQVMHVDTAIDAIDAGADMIVFGVGGGQQCTTSWNADIPVVTPLDLYKARKAGIKADIGIEGGGVGSHIITAFALGADVLLKAGEIGISYEGMGGKYGLRDKQGRWYMLYDGEASDSSKRWRDFTDALGRIEFPEGEPGFFRFGKKLKGLTDNIRRLCQQLAIGGVFQRVTPDLVEALHQRGCHDIMRVTDEVAGLSAAYGNHNGYR